MAEEDQQTSGCLEHQGDHHIAKIAVDSSTGKVAAGGIYNFSENAGAMLQVRGGKVEGTIAHSGDNHRLQLNVASNGKFEGTYVDARGIEVEFKGGVATLTKGQIPAGGIKIKGDHHSVTLENDANGKLRGTITSDCPNSTFQLDLVDNKIGGKIVYKGDGHETAFSLGTGGSWGASVSVGKGDAKFTFSFEKGRGGEVKGAAGLKLKF
ncbi:MAG: hypothetical protein WC969_13625 [Elusimicrobiota bacterium]|jgi:hypothetical protein